MDFGKRQPYTRLSNRAILYTLSLLVIVGTIIRIHFLFRTMRYDEAWTFLHYASRPFLVGVSDYSAPNNHIFHTILVHLAYVLLGNRPWILRLPAFIAGLVLIPVSYLLGARADCRATGLLTALFVTISAPLIDYSVNARGYTLIVLFSTLSFAMGFRLVRKSSLREWSGLAICSILGFLTAPVMVYPFVTLIIWMALCIVWYHTCNIRFTDLAQLCVVVAVGTFLLYMPMLNAGGWHNISTHPSLERRSVSVLVKTLPQFLNDYAELFRNCMPLFILCVLAFGVVTALFLGSGGLCIVRLLLFATVPPVFFIAAVVKNWPFGRVLIYLFPIYIVTACSGLVLVSQGLYRMARDAFLRIIGIVAGFATLAVAASGLITDHDGYLWSDLPNGDRLAAHISGLIRPGDAILAGMGTDTPLEYYLRYFNVPFSRIITDPTYRFNAYSSPNRGLQSADCWTRLIVVENHLFNDRLSELLAFMGSIGPATIRSVWHDEAVNVYTVSKFPENTVGVLENGNWMLNGGFEARNGCWVYRGAIAVQGDSIHNGSFALAIGPHSGGAWQRIAVRPSSTYRFHAWGRLSRFGGVGWLGVTLNQQAQDETKQQCEINSTRWQNCTFTFTTPVQLSEASVFAWNGEGEAQFIVDEFRVEAVSAVTSPSGVR
jgi:hypothetical protein